MVTKINTINSFPLPNNRRTLVPAKAIRHRVAILAAGIFLLAKCSARKRINLANTCIGPIKEAKITEVLSFIPLLCSSGNVWLTNIPCVAANAANVMKINQNTGFRMIGITVSKNGVTFGDWVLRVDSEVSSSGTCLLGSGLPYQNSGAVTKINVKLNRCKVLSQPMALLRMVETEYETLLANPAWSVINTIAFLELSLYVRVM